LIKILELIDNNVNNPAFTEPEYEKQTCRWYRISWFNGSFPSI